MTLAQIKTMFIEILSSWFSNKKVLDKLSENTDGNLLFDGQEIKGSDITISEEGNNAIQKKSDGIFAEDKSEQIEGIQIKVNQLNIAQKTVNEVSSMSLLETPFSFTSTKATTNGTGLRTKINTTISLKEDITNFDSIEILLSPNNISRKRPAQITKCRVNTIVYNNTTTIDYSNGSFIRIPFDVETTSSNHLGSYHFSLQIWFMDSKTIYIYDFLNPVAMVEWTDFKIVDIIGIKDKFITIDPVEYVNTTNGIEDTPVGHIISHMGNNAPKHYLICDGTEYNISDYPYLAQHFMDEFGSYNYFGGDGTTTFAVPDLRGEFLRGTGENSHQSGCDGTTVGEHQDGSDVVGGYFGSTNGTIYVGENMYHTNMNTKSDNWIPNTGVSNFFNRSSTYSSSYPNTIGKGTSRPTNTSVLYCIKYEPTYFMNINNTGAINYSEEEQIIGTWIDGKPLYRKVVQCISASSLNSSQATNISALNIDKVIRFTGSLYDGNAYYPISFNLGSGDYINTYISPTNIMTYVGHTAYINKPMNIILEYTKTTD